MRTGPVRRSAPPAPQPGRARTSGKVLRKLALGLVVAFALLETIPRFVRIPGLDRATLDPPYLQSEDARAFGPHPYLIFTPKPDYSRTPEQSGRGKQFRHGPRGFRAPAPPLEKPSGTTRIACLGGSSTYGTGPSTDEATWAAQLGLRLNAREGAAPVDVLNAGVPSWTSFESLSSLAFRVLPYEPDVVLVYLSTNDAESALWPNPTSDNAHYRVAWPTFRPSPLEPLLERSVTYLAWRRYFTDYLDRRADAGFVGKVVPEGEAGRALQEYRMPALDGPPPDQGFENFRRNLVSIVAVARAHGATPVLLTQALWSPDPTSDDLKHGAVLLEAHERMTDVVHAVAAERDVPVIDMKTFMADAVRAQIEAGGAQTLFTNNVHMTDEGAARFAERLASELVRLGVL